MGVLRKLTRDEIGVLDRLSKNPEFQKFRQLLGDSLNVLREESELILDMEQELVSKGKRLCLIELLKFMDRDEIGIISQRMSDEAELNNNAPSSF